MAYGVKALSKIQLGKETAAGTEVNATTIWRGEGVMKDDSPIKFVDEDLGSLQDQGRTYTPRVGCTVELDETPASFEQLPYLGMAGIDGSVTGTVDGTGTGYIYAFTLATSTQKAPKTYTLEGGDNSQEYQCLYGFCEEFMLSGVKNEAVTMSAKLRGRQMAAGTFTGSLSVPTVEVILFNKGVIYVDDTTIGTTQKTGTWLGFKLNIPTGFVAGYYGDGQLYFYAVKQTDLKAITGELVLENDTTGVAEVAKARAETTRLVRMVFSGSTLTTAGTAYTYKTLKIDLALKYTAVPESKPEDGDNVLAFPFKLVYHASGGVMTVVNQLSALT
jgi:hypothetical protein